jgi:hypothetical protein
VFIAFAGNPLEVMDLADDRAEGGDREDEPLKDLVPRRRFGRQEPARLLAGILLLGLIRRNSGLNWSPRRMLTGWSR